jgi:hypothetical protein
VAIRASFKFRGLDSSKSINDRYSKLVGPGLFHGGEVVPVVGQLKVDVAPWKIVSESGMVVEETADTTRLTVVAGQTAVIAIKAMYQDNADPVIAVEAHEISSFNALPLKAYYVVLAHVETPVGAAQVLGSYIKYEPRETIDKVQRSKFRGMLDNSSLLPATGNHLGDFYIVVSSGGLPNLYAWNGTLWKIMTDSVQLAADLAGHRQNLLTDEKHLTDDEKAAVVGTSGTPVSGTNKLVDNADTRIPTQDENDALQGTHGSPSDTNRFVTQELPLSVPEEKTFSTPATLYALLPTSDGPFYVGKQVPGTAAQYFKFYDAALEREYTRTADNAAVTVVEVYKDSALTQILDPATDPAVDADGFFTGNVYLKFSTPVPDTGFRVVYGKYRTLGDLPAGALMRRPPRDAQASAEVVRAIEAIKGRDFDVTPPTAEQNIELRKDIIDLKEFVSAVFKADFVAHDFSKVDGVPDFNGDFVANIGIPQNYSFENTGLVGMSYSSGTVTYSSAVSLGSVLAGHIFLDGSGAQFRVTATGANSLSIVRRDGTTPSTINTTVTTAAHGSVKPDNNPRSINLSTLDTVVGRDRVVMRSIEMVRDEFHPDTDQIAFAIRTPLHSAFYREPRVRLYGGFKNRDVGELSKVVATSSGSILVTGFFTDLVMLVDVKTASPTVTVKVDGVTYGSPIDLSRSGAVANTGSTADVQMQYVPVASNLTDLVPHTVEISVSLNTADDFIVYGFDLVRFSLSNTLILPGRAFVQSDLYKQDTIQQPLTPSTITQGRGAVIKRFINRSLALQTSTSQLTDLDGSSNIPAGTAVTGSFLFTCLSGLAKFANYKAGDIVKLVTATTEEVLLINSIPLPGQAQFTTAIAGSGSAVLFHVCSTAGGPALDPVKESARFSPQELGIGSMTDFSYNSVSPGDRTYTVEDGTTQVSGTNVQYVTTGIDGVDIALSMVSSASKLRIRAVCARMDILVANAAATSADVSVDGAPAYTRVIGNTGLQRISLFQNARYQSHEAYITNASGLMFCGLILFEPAVAEPEGCLLSTQNLVARYVTPTLLEGDSVSMGAVAIDPEISGGIYVNGTGAGTDWASSIDFTKNPAFGRYVTTSREGSYFEYYVMGEGFEVEYFANSNQGRPRLLINNVLVTSANFPGAIFRGVNTTTGEVDMYAATQTRRRFGISGLTLDRYTVRLEVQTPRVKNVSSSDFFINATSVYELNTHGLVGVSPSRSTREDFVYGLDAVRDERNFDSGAVSREEVPVQRSVLIPTRNARVSVAIGTTSAIIVFSTPMPTPDYVVTCNFMNFVDGSPLLQPIAITANSVNGLTATWNLPLDSGNYVLSYSAVVAN